MERLGPMIWIRSSFTSFKNEGWWDDKLRIFSLSAANCSGHGSREAFYRAFPGSAWARGGPIRFRWGLNLFPFVFFPVLLSLRPTDGPSTGSGPAFPSFRSTPSLYSASPFNTSRREVSELVGFTPVRP